MVFALSTIFNAIAQDSTAAYQDPGLIKVVQLPSGKGMFASITDDAVGIMAETLVIGIGNDDDGKNIIVIGAPNELEDSEDMPKGIIVTRDGTILLNSERVFIQRAEYGSHAEADLALLKGQEYYLIGDRNLYRKP